jgi:hypothetical protein
LGQDYYCATGSMGSVCTYFFVSGPNTYQSCQTGIYTSMYVKGLKK